jgi:hypothetical protein
VEPGRQLAAALEEMLALHRLSTVLSPESGPAPCRLRGRAAGGGVRAIPGRTRQFQ